MITNAQILRQSGGPDRPMPRKRPVAHGRLRIGASGLGATCRPSSHQH